MNVFLLLLIIVGFAAVVTAVIGVIRQRNAKVHFRKLLKAEMARRESEKQYGDKLRHDLDQAHAQLRTLFETMITERKQAEEALAEKNRELQEAFERSNRHAVEVQAASIIPGIGFQSADREAAHRKEPAAVIFDGKSFSDRLINDNELMGETIRIFLDDAPRQIRELAQKIKNRDQDLATQIAHTIKGSAANVSGQRLRDAVMQVETACRSADWRQAESLAPKLERQFEQLEKAMREFQNRWKPLKY